MNIFQSSLKVSQIQKKAHHASWLCVLNTSERSVVVIVLFFLFVFFCWRILLVVRVCVDLLRAIGQPDGLGEDRKRVEKRQERLSEYGELIGLKSG